MNMETKKETKDLEDLYTDTMYKIVRGIITTGKIIAINDNGITVDIGYKSEGIIPASEFTEEEILSLHEREKIEVFIEKINDGEGMVVLSKDKAFRIRRWEKLAELHQNNTAVECKITGKTKGGLLGDIMGVSAFLPTSQIDIKPPKDIDSYVGQVFDVKILKITPLRGSHTGTVSQFGSSLIVSRKTIIEDERNIKKTEILKTLKEGSILKGVVKNITNYGVFVDLGGIDGLLHISDISWRRINHPSEFFNIGDEKEFIVLKYDPDNEKITLGYKQKKEDPWISVNERYKEGATVKGRVVNITDYGVFVEIEEGLEGLVHISELNWASRPKHPSKYASVGNEVQAVVISINKDERKLSLSFKQLQPKPWDIVAEKYSANQQITGKIKTITDFGAFIRLPEGVDGLIHISDISWTKHIKHPSEVFKKGQKVNAVILSLEPDKEKMALGIKQLTVDPWEKEIPAKFRTGDEFKGKVLRLTDFGIFVEMENEVEGLVYSSEIDHSIEAKEGDEIAVRVIKINADERKIGLSMKNLKGGRE